MFNLYSYKTTNEVNFFKIIRTKGKRPMERVICFKDQWRQLRIIRTSGKIKINELVCQGVLYR